MSLASLVALQAALALLMLVNTHPQLPQSTRDYAQQVAQQAITQATTELAARRVAPVGGGGGSPSPAPITVPAPIPSPSPAPTHARAQFQPHAPGTGKLSRAVSLSRRIKPHPWHMASHASHKPGRAAAVRSVAVRLHYPYGSAPTVTQLRGQSVADGATRYGIPGDNAVPAGSQCFSRVRRCPMARRLGRSHTLLVCRVFSVSGDADIPQDAAQTGDAKRTYGQRHGVHESCTIVKYSARPHKDLCDFTD